MTCKNLIKGYMHKAIERVHIPEQTLRTQVCVYAVYVSNFTCGTKTCETTWVYSHDAIITACKSQELVLYRKLI